MTTHAQPLPAARRSFWLYAPPPLLFVATFLLGVLLGQPARVAIPASFAAAARVAGIFVIAPAALLMLSAALMFLVLRTTIIPHGTSRRLVTRGAFRFTRNPMYVGLTSIYIGVALVTGLVWPLLLLPIAVMIIHTKVIPFEESQLARSFGDEYRAYQQRVPRWLWQ